jgi:predicted transcriptional regulator
MIIANMLSTINDSGSDGANKTTIMHKSFLSYAQLKEYLSFMVEKGLIDESPHHSSGNEKFARYGPRYLCFAYVNGIWKQVINLIGPLKL